MELPVEEWNNKTILSTLDVDFGMRDSQIGHDGTMKKRKSTFDRSLDRGLEFGQSIMNMAGGLSAEVRETGGGSARQREVMRSDARSQATKRCEYPGDLLR